VIYLFGITDAPAPTGLTSELGGAPIVAVEAGGLCALGAHLAPPACTAESLAAHDRTVRLLARITGALIPARFGQRLDEPTLSVQLSERAHELATRLESVRGRVQMTVRILPSAASPAPETSAGPGLRYLAERRRTQTLADLPAAALARHRQGRLVCEERIERHARGPFAATLYHLIAERDVEAYKELAAAEAPSLTASGPWPTYAFTETP
jgi:hypothetical protein